LIVLESYCKLDKFSLSYPL